MAFGRILEITAYNDNGNAYVLCDRNSDLEVKLEGVKKTGFIRPQFSIEIYNLDPVVYGNIATNNYNRIVVKAGYEDEDVETIFKGTILHIVPNWESGNTIIYNFICISGKAFCDTAIANQNFVKGTNLYQVAEYLAKNTGVEGITTQLSDRLKEIELQQDKVYAGSAYDKLNEIAEDNNMVFQMEDDLVYISEYKDKSNAIVVRPETGMIDFPKLTNIGLNVKVLFSPLYKIGEVIKIDTKNFINEQSADAESYLQGERALVQFSTDGTYFIKSIKYDLSSRSGDFCLELECLSRELYLNAFGGVINE